LRGGLELEQERRRLFLSQRLRIQYKGAQDRIGLSVNVGNGQEPGAVPPGGYRILIVEDAPHIMEMFGYALKRLAQKDLGGKIPFEVHFAPDGHQALQKLKEQPFHLVMTDLRMPVMDGFELVRRIREDPQLAHIAVIAISGMDPEEAQVRALDVGVDIYLRKPVQFTHVAETVKRLLKLGV
jgi:CheY-like chemotaxis protein